MAAVDTARAQTGFFCSTSGTTFTSKEELAEHYKSDFHRYNLKRKVAGLPPVTKEWFEARKAQLSSAAASGAAVAPVQRTWVDPLTKKKFSTENTYQAFVRSNKYLDLVRKSGQPAPEPLIITRQAEQEDAEEKKQGGSAAPAAPAAPGFKLVPPPGGLKPKADTDMDGGVEEDGEGDDDSGWETASDDEAAELAEAAAKDADWPDWDVRRSLFDGHESDSLEANLEYMYRTYGFYLPDSEYLKDPEGLIKYLGAKLQAGHVPLYIRGDDPNAKSFRSLHAVQRHMVDTCQCKMLYDGNEEEYEEFYDYSAQADDPSGAIVLAGDGAGAGGAVAGYELVVGDAGGGGGGRVLGHRDFARFYRQRPKPEDERRSVVVNTMLAKYRLLGAPTADRDRREDRAATAAHRSGLASQLKMSMIKNNLKKLPKNCEY
ncbi:hypothetical protein HYH03_012457 [Edaphochlamys debaryana]|uniref:ZN622/Rei1/Reh1 zinc finger C2H2-type domain-containing protein n=1 Tax=Edaphochlamys debaryana TaxID=47281 RepID=A0A835Y0P7_9CHLO|nr:hypothetical protein HYH03_012457 [Edaphochlamys debaryana]|eukprot:KAG2489019.1 hypothetical protein HYH03_012457 [Edaphochlamys debaryana]